MILEQPLKSESLLTRFDPRVRILCGAAAALAPLFLTGFVPLALALMFSGLAAALAGIAMVDFRRRFTAVNLFMAMLAAILPWSVPGQSLMEIGSLTYSREGLAQAAHIALKANAIMLVVSAFWGTMDPTVFAHALQRVGLPQRLIVLLLFTVRYLAVLEHESLRLRQAMTVRAFRPRLDLHTLRSYGYLVGMILVRAFDRSERVLNAMKCRGFSGKFVVHWHFQYRAIDGVLAAATALAIVAVVLAGTA